LKYLSIISPPKVNVYEAILINVLTKITTKLALTNVADIHIIQLESLYMYMKNVLF